MGDRVNVTLTIGGRIKPPYVPRLMELLEEYDFRDEDWNPISIEKLGETLQAEEVNWGNIDPITDWLREQNLAYEHWMDGHYEWSPCTEKWLPGWPAPRTMTQDDSGEYLVSESELERLGYDEVMALFATMKKPLPQLVIDHA